MVDLNDDFCKLAVENSFTAKEKQCPW